MSSKDERIVQMVFDNAAFEKGVEKTRRTLKELDQSLEFKNATDGFSKISSAANGVDLSAIANGVEALQNRFSLFGIMGMKVMEEIAGAAINVGKRLWDITFGQIKSGGIRRAMNVENAHFMLQGLLKDEAEVQRIMDLAMDSVDGTAYAFDSAAKAASQFAASGVTANDELTRALKGITGVAAMTNSEYEDISRIFTTVAGNGRLMGDQLLQLSGRGMNAASTLVEFFNGVNDGSKQASEGVTEYVKTITKGAQVTEMEVRDMVSKGKISFDVFSEAMNEAFGEHAKKANETLNGVLANVKSALSKIGADFVTPLIVQNGPLVEFFNALREAINRVRKEMGPFQKEFVNAVTKMAEKGTAFLKYIKIEYIFQALAKGLDLVKQLVKPIGEAFRSVFGEKTIFQMNVSLNKFKEFVTNLQISERVVNNVRSIFGGFFAVLSIGRQLISALIQLFRPLLEHLFDFGGSVMDTSASIGDLLMQFDNWLKTSGFLNDAVVKIQGTVGKFVDWIKKILQSKFIQDFVSRFKSIINGFINFLKDKFGSFDNVSLKLSEFFSNIKTNMSNFLRSDILTSIKKVISNIIDGVSTLAEKVWKAGSSIISVIRDVFANIDFSSAKATGIGLITGALNLLGEAIEWVGGVAVDFSGSIKTLFDGVGTIAGGIFEGLIDIIKNLTGTMSKEGTFSLDNILDAVAIGGIITIINQLSDCLSKFTNNVSSDTLKTTAEAIGILTLALVGLANIEQDRLESAVGVISILFGELVGSYQLMRKTSAGINGKKIGDTLRQFIGAFTGKNGFGTVVDSLASLAAGFKFKNLVDISKAILMLAGAVVILSLVPEDRLYSSIGAISALMIGLTLMFKSMSKMDTKNATSTAGILIGTGIALDLISMALANIAKLDKEAIQRGLTGLTIIMLEFGMLSKTISKARGMWFGNGVGFVLVATAIVIFGAALKSISNLNYEQLAGGLIALGGGLILMSTAMAIVSKASGGKGVLRIATALTIIAFAMGVFADAISKIAKFDVNQIGGAMAGLAGSILLTIVALAAIDMLPGEKKIIKTGLALNIIAASMVIFAEAISRIGVLSLDQVGSSVAGLAGAMALAISALAAVDMLPNERELIRTGLALNIIAASMVIFAEAISRIGALSLDQVGSAIAGLGGAMLLAISALAAVDMLPGERELFKTGAALIVIGLAMNVFSESISRLAKYDVNQIGGAMAGLAGSMALAIASLAALNMLPGETDLFKIGAALGIVGAAMLIFGDAIKNVSGMDLNSIGASLAGLAGAMALAIAAIAALSMIPDSSTLFSTGASLVIIAGAMIIFGEALNRLSGIPLDSIGNSLAGLAGTMVLAIATIAALTRLNTKKVDRVAKSMIAMGIAMGLFAAAIKMLDGLSTDTLLYSVLAIGIALGTVAGIAAMMAPLAGPVQKLGLAFLAFGGGVAVAGIGIAAAAAAITGFILVLMKLGEMGSGAIKSVTVNIAELLSGVADALGGALSRFVKYFDEHSDEFIRGIIGFFESVVGAVIAIIPGTILSIAVAFGEGLRKLADSNALYDITDGLMRVLIQACDGLGKNAEPLVNSLIDTIIAVLKAIGERTEDLVAEAIVLLINLINGLAGAVVEYSGPLIDAIENIFKAIVYFIITVLQEVFKLIPGIGEKMAAGLEGVKEEIAGSMTTEDGKKLLHQFGHGMEEELEATRDRLQQKMYWTFNMPDVLPEEWKAAQLRSISLFGDEAMANYVMAMQYRGPEVEAEAMKIINSPISLAEKQKKLYETIGGDYIDYFAYGIKSHQISADKASQEFLAAQEAYAKEMGYIVEEAANDAINTMEELTPQMKGEAYNFYMAYANDPTLRAELVEEMRNNGRAGVAAYIDTFSDPAALEDARRYAQEIGYGTAEELAQPEKAVESAQTNYIAYSQTLKEEGAAESKEAADAVGGSFIDELGTYVGPAVEKGKEYIGGMTESVKLGTPDYQSEIDNMMNGGLTDIEGYGDLYQGATEENVNKMTTGATSAGDNYIRVMKQIGTKGPLELVKQKNEYKNAGSGNIGEYSAGLGSSSALKDIVNAIAEGVSRALKRLIEYGRDFNSRGAGNISEYAKGMTSHQRDAENAASTVAGFAERGLGSKNASFKAQGNTATKSFAGGLEAFGSVVRSSAAVIAQKGVEGSGSRKDQFTGKGRDAGQGFANGMEEKNSVVYNKAWSLAGRALAGLQERLRSNSPSKETMALGNYAGDGFAIGITQYGTTVKRVSEDLAGEALDGLQNGMKEIARIADMDMDYAPTIRPVLDFNDITNGITAMDSMFDQSHAIAAQASFDMYQTYGQPDYITQFAKMAADNESRMSNIIDRQTEVLLDIRSRLAHQQIVLDSGELVGATINKIDEALGERMFRAERGNG